MRDSLNRRSSGNQTFAKLAYQKLYYHLLGDPVEKDRLIYETAGRSGSGL